MRTFRTGVLWFGLAAGFATTVASGLAACGNKEAGATYFGKSPVPPGKLAQLRKGMTVDEVKKIVAIAAQGSDFRFDTGQENVLARLDFNDGKFNYLSLKIRGDEAKTYLPKAWGPGTKDRNDLVWTDANAGWKANLFCETNCVLHYRNYVPLTPAFFGKAVAPVGPLAGLKLGMTAAEVAAAPSGQALLKGYIDAGPDETQVMAYLDKKRDRLRHFSIMVPKSGLAVMAQAWGKPTDVTSSYKKQPDQMWFNAAEGWRARADQAMSVSNVQIDAYLPVSKLLGEGASVAMLPTLPWGGSLADVQKAYPNVTVEGTSTYIDLPPTEFDDFQTRVHFWIYQDNLNSVRFAIKYEGTANAKTELLGLFKKKWGEPVKTEGDTQVFGSAAPFVRVRDNTIMKSWDLELKGTL